MNLSFRGVRYHLGYFKDFNEATQARLDGEEMVREFVENYLNTMTEQSDDEKVAKMKQAFEDNIRAKEKSEVDFKRNVCKNKGYAFISPKTIVLGGIQIEEHLLVSGEVQGDIKCSKSLMINGKIEGNVTAEIVYIPNGKVVGSVMAKNIFCSNIREQVLGEVIGNIAPYIRIEKF